MILPSVENSEVSERRWISGLNPTKIFYISSKCLFIHQTGTLMIFKVLKCHNTTIILIASSLTKLKSSSWSETNEELIIILKYLIQYSVTEGTHCNINQQKVQTQEWNIVHTRQREREQVQRLHRFFTKNCTQQLCFCSVIW